MTCRGGVCCSLFILSVACGGSSPAGVGEPAVSAAAPDVGMPPAGASAAEEQVVPSSAPAEPSAAHAPGGAQCQELAKACHDVGHGADEAGKCHQVGHAGDNAACAKEHARCITLCSQKVPGQSTQPHPKGGHKH